jgi:hypothetical protein
MAKEVYMANNVTYVNSNQKEKLLKKSKRRRVHVFLVEELTHGISL